MKNKLGLKIIFTVFILGWFVWPALAVAAEEGVTTDSPPAKPSAAENINVELKVPLPFIKTTDGKVNNLKDYIEGVYRFLIGAGAVFAVVMIIIAGYQWMLSGGSADKTGAAKKRLWNASIGLVLAMLSYIILNAISARLVELRLPKVDPVPPFYAGADNYCNSQAMQELLQKATDKDRFLVELSGNGPVDFDNKGIPVEQAVCGKKYLAAGNSGQCQGQVCLTEGKADPKKTCVDGKCGSTMMYGNIEWSPANGFVDYIRVYPVCGAALMGEAGHIDVREKARAYAIINEFQLHTEVREVKGPNQSGTGTFSVEAPLYKIRADNCSNLLKKEFKGFVLEVEVNNDCYWFPVDDDDFAMGKSNTTPIYKDRVYDFDDIDWGQVNKDALIQMSDLENKAFQYNLVIDRTNFPVPRQIGVDPPANCPVR